MTLKVLLESIFQSPDAPIRWESMDISFGFVTPPPDGESWTVKAGETGYTLVEGTQDAFVAFQAPLAVLEALFSGQGDANALMRQVTVLPRLYGFQIAHFMQAALGIEIDPEQFALHGQFPLPLRYPVAENLFLSRRYTPEALPAYDAAALPALVADDHPDWVAMYNKAWEIGFGNLRQPEPDSGFVSNFIDTAFNDNTFMWDSSFMTMFGRYGRRVFDFMGTLENFYGKQHADGFICREINTYDGRDLFTPQDPRSTGPNIMGWTEWIDYQYSGDLDRLKAVFPALVAYHRWWRDWRSWPDGSYFTCGWGSGMDNQTRVPDSWWHHRHYSWVDATMQQALNCQVMLRMAAEINRSEFSAEFEQEYEHLAAYINQNMWDEASGFYYDRAPDGSLTTVMSIGAYWGLLAGIVPTNRARRMIAHLEDPQRFNRPHRVPSAAYGSAGYAADGQYWRGGVWIPTNYMLLNALIDRGDDDLAYAIARNHYDNVVQVFKDTGTVWENYAPEQVTPGSPAKPDFVGWTGVSAINVPIEYVLGLRANAPARRLLWDVRLTERHGILGYPLGIYGTLDLICARRENDTAAPHITVSTDTPITLDVRWAGGSLTRQLASGTHEIHQS